MNNNNNKTLTGGQLVNGLIPHHKQNGTVANGSAKHHSQPPPQLIQNHSLSPERAVSVDTTDSMRHISKQKQNKINRNNRKKNNTEEALSPDEVFMPKDIDLDNGELDE
ncbi:unnamed protein product, partial [Oppiella nova]